MDKSFLVKLIGFHGTLLHGDPLVWDRWRWLVRRLPVVKNPYRLLDVGCGTGAFTIGAARCGYDALGLSWDSRNQQVAAQRAALCNAAQARFEVLDVRSLDTRVDLESGFDIAVCLETAEHILDDRKLLRDIAACLKPGGWLLFSAPNRYYRPIDYGDIGPFETVEQGWHVRRGYTPGMLHELSGEAGLICEEISFCGGFLSQKLTRLWRIFACVSPILALAMTFPLRLFPILLDGWLRSLWGWPDFSICMVAYKPRFGSTLCVPRSVDCQVSQ